jgi:hypothetical protein
MGLWDNWRTTMVELSDMVTTDDEGRMMTKGEALILSKLEAIQIQLDDVTEKIHNLNLYENDGFSGDD